MVTVVTVRAKHGPRQPRPLLKLVLGASALREATGMWQRMRQLKSRIAVAAVIAMSVASAANSQISGNLILDSAVIPICAPVSGVIEMRVQQDTEIPGSNWYALSFNRGAYAILITTPHDSTVVVDNVHVADGGVACYGPLTGSTTLFKNETYAFPIFLLRNARGFIFDTPGNYEVTYKFDVLPGRPEFSANLRVSESDSQGCAAFMSAFASDAAIYDPFCGAALREPLPKIDPSSPYFEALQITEASAQRSRLLISMLLNSTPTDYDDSERKWLIGEMNTRKVARGVELDAAMAHPRGVWKVVQLRQTALRTDPIGVWVEPRDNQGRIIITAP